MESLNKSGQRQIQIDDENPITLLKNPEKFKERFNQMIALASDYLKTQDYEKSLKNLSQCLDMLDLGKNIMKDTSKYLKLCIYGNLACAYQGTWKMQKCHKFCQKIEQQLEKLLQTAEQKQVSLNLKKYLIRVKFQHCAILSQLSQHEKALSMCKSILPTILQYINSILHYSQSLKTYNNDKKSSQTVQFSKHVTSFAEQILKNLQNCLKQPLKLNIDKSSFYYWQKNPENNQKQVEKKFVSTKSGQSCKRSILGVNKMSHWIDQFNIGSIMHMSQMNISDFEKIIPIQQYIFKDKLYETVILCSIAHFTIATQMRFIETSNQTTYSQKTQSSQNSAYISSNIQLINKKYGYDQKSQLFQKSQLYHLRAINIMAQNIKTTVPYLSHLIKSYDKHYIFKKQLEPVLAIPQQSLMSINESNQKSLIKKDYINTNNVIIDNDNYFTSSKIKSENKKQYSIRKQKMIDDDYNYNNNQSHELFQSINILDQLEDQQNRCLQKVSSGITNKNIQKNPQNQNLKQQNQENKQNSRQIQPRKFNKIKSTQKIKMRPTFTQKNLSKNQITKKKNQSKKNKETDKQIRLRNHSAGKLHIVCKRKK